MFTPEISLFLELVGILALGFLSYKLIKSIKQFFSHHFSFKQFFIFASGHLALFLMLTIALANTALALKHLGLAALGLTVGYFFADLFTGFYHFMLDNFKFKNVPVLENQAKEFQQHHDDPLDITRQTLGELFYGPMWGVVLYLFIAFPPIFIYHSKISFGLAMLWFSLGYPLFASYSQLIHMWSHKDVGHKQSARRKVVDFLRKYKIILNSRHHLAHHNNFHQNYEIVNGHSSKITDRVYKFIHDKILKR